MKIYDIVEGKWMKEDKEKKNEKEIEDYENFGIGTRLITYDEEKEWIQKESRYITLKNRKKCGKMTEE